MKIEFDNHDDEECFLILLSSLISMSELEEYERNFIDRLHKSIIITKTTNGDSHV